ncbi:hypothetical protein [Rhodococcus sp. PD04]|uniref:hypothetical protein n=1 Tax=Rhodococcus sp. PD04 TaxID=3109594 RepID=UPI002DDC4CE4|nr:hypothetical protein [Rhodococcus sp. PD04]WSE23841.1 hypothetical protein U9J23_05955 [Rhodococcus sp. PD04]
MSTEQAMDGTMSFPPKGTIGRPREERAVEGAVLVYRAVVKCSAEGKLPNVKTICQHAGVSATDRNPLNSVYFFHLGRTLCVEAGLLTVTARGRSQVYSAVGQSLTDVEVASAVTKVITPEMVALQRKGRKSRKGRNIIKGNRLTDNEFTWDFGNGAAGEAGFPVPLSGETASPQGAL